MVVSNSSKINRRAAKENVATQAKTRAANLAKKATSASKQFAKEGNTAGANRFAEQAAGYNAVPEAPNDFITPTNTLQPGFNPNAQFDFNKGQYKEFSGQGNIRSAFQAGTDPRVRAILQQRGVQELAPEQTQRLNDWRSGKTNLSAEEAGQLSMQEMESANAQNELAQQDYQKQVTQGTTQGPQRTQQENQAIDPQIATLLQGIPPEYQAIIAQNYQAQNAALQQQAGLAGQMAAQQEQSADNIFKAQTEGTDQQLLDEEQAMKDAKLAAYESEEEQKQFLEDQKKVAIEELELNNQRNLEIAEKNKKEDIARRIATMVLSGAANSADANLAISQAETSLNEHIDFLRSSQDINKQKILNEFRGNYLTIEQNADNAIAQAVKDYNNEKKLINNRIIDAKVSKEQAKAKAKEGLYANLSQILQERAKNIASIADKSIGLVREQQQILAQDRERAFTELKWYKDTFGSELPEGVMEDLQKRLPNMNVQSFFATQTAAERKAAERRVKLGSGGAAWLSGFSLSELKSDGAPLSFEEYLEKRKQEEGFYNQQKRDDFVGPLSKVDFLSSLPTKQKEEAFRNRIQAEYIAKMEEKNKLSPDQILSTLNKAMSKTSVPNHTRENAVQNVNALIAKGDYQGAYDFVDGLGSAPSATERGAISRAQNARMQVVQLKQKIDELGAMGPVIGRLRELNPYDDKIVEIDAMITTTVPNLARGVFGEVGVLTDFDIKNYTSAMANPKLTHSQAITLTRNLLNTIDYNVKSQLGVMRASGLSTRELESLYEGQIAEMSVPTAEDDYINSYLNSLQYQ